MKRNKDGSLSLTAKEIRQWKRIQKLKTVLIDRTKWLNKTINSPASTCERLARCCLGFLT